MGIAVHKQYLVIFLILDLQENIYTQVEKTESGRRIVNFSDFSIHILLEVQNEKYCEILYLIDYIANGPQFPHKFWNSPKSVRKQKWVILTPDISSKNS